MRIWGLVHYVMQLKQHCSLHNHSQELQSRPKHRANLADQFGHRVLVSGCDAADEIALVFKTELQKACNILLQTLEDTSFLKKYSTVQSALSLLADGLSDAPPNQPVTHVNTHVSVPLLPEQK